MEGVEKFSYIEMHPKFENVRAGRKSESPLGSVKPLSYPMHIKQALMNLALISKQALAVPKVESRVWTGTFCTGTDLAAKCGTKPRNCNLF